MWGLAGATLVGSGIAYFRVFSHSVIDGTATANAMRVAIAVEIGLGAALAISSLVTGLTTLSVRRAVYQYEHEEMVELPDEPSEAGEATPEPAG